MKDNVSAEKNTANREELYAMITAAQNGDKKAMETLTEQNMGLVRSVAQRFRDRGVEYEDLVQIGVMGMFRAIKSFDVSYQTAFSTYVKIFQDNSSFLHYLAKFLFYQTR